MQIHEMVLAAHEVLRKAGVSEDAPQRYEAVREVVTLMRKAGAESYQEGFAAGQKAEERLQKAVLDALGAPGVPSS